MSVLKPETQWRENQVNNSQTPTNEICYFYNRNYHYYQSNVPGVHLLKFFNVYTRITHITITKLVYNKDNSWIGD